MAKTLALACAMIGLTAKAEVVRITGTGTRCVNGACYQTTSSGTAFSIANSGQDSYWLTCGHGWDDISSMQIYASGKSHPATIVKRERNTLYDYSLVRVAGFRAKENYCFPESINPRGMNSCTVAGYPGESGPMQTLQGQFGEMRRWRLNSSQCAYGVNGSFTEGWSGSPVLVTNNGCKYSLGVLSLSNGVSTPTYCIKKRIESLIPGGLECGCEVAPAPPDPPDLPKPTEPDIPVDQLPPIPSSDCSDCLDRIAMLEKQVATLAGAVEANSKWIAVKGRELSSRLEQNTEAIDDFDDRLRKIEAYKRTVQTMSSDGTVRATQRYGWDDPIILAPVPIKVK